MVRGERRSGREGGKLGANYDFPTLLAGKQDFIRTITLTVSRVQPQSGPGKRNVLVVSEKTRVKSTPIK